MDRRYKVGGYVKLAKLWERSKDAAVAYHSAYYAEKFKDDGLAAGKDHQFKGRYDAEKNAVIISLEKGE